MQTSSAFMPCMPMAAVIIPCTYVKLALRAERACMQSSPCCRSLHTAEYSVVARSAVFAGQQLQCSASLAYGTEAEAALVQLNDAQELMTAPRSALASKLGKGMATQPVVGKRRPSRLSQPSTKAAVESILWCADTACIQGRIRRERRPNLCKAL